MTLNGDETIRKVTKGFKVGTPGQVKWGVMLSGGYLAQEGEGLSVNGNEVSLKPTYASETLVAYMPDNTYKSYTIKVTPKVFAGEGTAESPYLINNVADLLMLQKAVNEAGQSHNGDYFRLTSDLDLGNTPDFTGIAAGNAAYSFGATFDGANHRISNFKVVGATKNADGTLASSVSYMGFFGICSKTSTIKNLIIDSSCSFTLYRYSAPVVGYTAGKVENCVNYADVQAWGIYNGGITGLVANEDAVVSGCVNFGCVTAVDGFNGGVTGVNYGLVEKSLNIGNVVLDADASISSAGSNENLGGIAGANFGKIMYSGNNGQINGLSSVGGIAGGNSSEKGYGSVIGCMNSAVVYGDASSGKIGAIIGNLASSTELSNNYYDSQIMPAGATGKGDGKGNKGLCSTDFNNYISNSSMWSSTEGYPVPYVLKDNIDAKKALSVVLSMSEQDNVNSMESGATLNGENTQWTLAEAGPFAINNGKLSFNLGDSKEGACILEATTPFGVKRFMLHAFAPLFSGKGTQSDPHLINTVADMLLLSEAVGGGRTFANHRFRITSNLDFAQTTYTPVGSSSSLFQGNVDGNGCLIKNLRIESTDDYVGLFGYCGSLASITNLSIDSTCAVSGKAYVGAFAGRFDGSLTNCKNYASVASTGNYCGGLAGYMAEGSNVDNCSNYGEVVSQGTYVGGIAGVLYGDAIKCLNAAAIKGKTTYVGGFTGSLRACLENCENVGEVASLTGGNYLGGLAASVEAGSQFINCVNRGNIVNGKAYVGGLFGGCPTAAGSMKADGAIVKYCKNYGAIAGSSTNVAGLAGLVAAGHHFYGCENYGSVTAEGNTSGGIAGETRGSADFSTSIDSCFNYGEVINTASGKKDIGGIIGKLATYSTLTRCGNYAPITSKGYMTGGVAGDITGSVADCYNLGAVTGATYAMGGVIGYAGTGVKIERCVNAGEVKATDSYTGTYGTAAGIVGYGYPVITDCANYGNLYGSKTVGGIAGSRFTAMDMLRCINTGKVQAPAGITSIGNIFSSQVAFTGPVWFDNEVNGPLPGDHSSYSGLKANELMALSIEGWSNAEASYPMPTSIAELPAVRFSAARFALAEGDSINGVAHDFNLASYPGFTWTSSNPQVVSIEGAKAKVSKAENTPVTLTLAWNGHQRQFNFVINSKGTGISNADAEEIVSVNYYTLDGLSIQLPTSGSICLKRSVYKSGKIKTEKIRF